MSVGLTIAGRRLRVDGSDVVEEAVRRRFGAFVGDGAAEIVIEVQNGHFDPLYQVVEPLALGWRGEIATFEGMGRGEYDPAAQRGFVRECTGLLPIDAMIRLALSTSLPRHRMLLLHGAALPGGVALCGASGTGKSTAAAALGAACDEVIALEVGDGELLLHATPYWGGRPSKARLTRLISLKRGGTGAQRLSGARAVRELLGHVVRYLASPSLDRAVLSVAAAACSLRPVEILDCPEGGAFLPFLIGQLEARA